MSGYPYLKKPSMEYFETLPYYSPNIKINSYDIPLFGEFCLSKKFLSCTVGSEGGGGDFPGEKIRRKMCTASIGPDHKYVVSLFKGLLNSYDALHNSDFLNCYASRSQGCHKAGQRP